MTEDERLNDLDKRLRDCAQAYPEYMFPPITDEERREHSELITRAAAQMGRHFAKLAIEAADEIQYLRNEISAEEWAYKLRDEY